MTGHLALTTPRDTSTLRDLDDRRGPLPDVLTRIATRSHDPLREELAAVLALLDDELTRHPGGDDETLQAICMTLRRLQSALGAHLDVEESQLIPLLWLFERGVRGRGVHITTLVGQLGHDQYKILSLLGRAQMLGRLYRRPARNTPAVSAAFAGLAELAQAVHAHLDHETRVLLPRLTAMAA